LFNKELKMKEISVFISYSRKDSDFCKMLASKLEKNGVKVWIDTSQIDAGFVWRDEIAYAIAENDHFLVILSYHSRSSNEVKREIEHALNLSKSVIPIKIDDSDLPLSLNILHYLDFYMGEFNKTFDELIHLLFQKAVSNIKRTRPKLSLRDSKRKLTSQEIIKTIKNYDFFCVEADWTRQWHNPRGKGINNNFSLFGEKVVYDKTTGLYWQRMGSEERYSLYSAKSYVMNLNNCTFGGLRVWRLPTFEEAMSLLKPQKNKNLLYINRLFDFKQEAILTSDESIQYDSYLVVSFIGGGLGLSIGDSFFVRAVCSS